MLTRAIGGAAVALAVAFAATPAQADVGDSLPDLAMAPLADFKIEKTPDGRKLLRYSTTVVNIGDGAMQAEGSRASTADTEMSVNQRIFNSLSGSRVVSTPAVMFFARDGHNHWHVDDLEISDLNRLDNGIKVGSGAKHGFCFYDLVAFNLGLPGAPGSKVYTTCGTNSSVLTQTMGISIGWGDVYRYSLANQWVDITNVAAGRYRLTTTADLQNRFLETNETNNVTWTDLQLKGNGLRVIAQGPSA